MTEIPTFKFAIREDLRRSNFSFLPLRATPTDTGWDVKAAPKDCRDISVKPGNYVKIPLGFRAFPEEGWWFELKPRSSTFAKKHLHCLYGTVDSTYEGEVILACQYIPDLCDLGKELVIKFGDAVGQIIPVKLQDMNVQEIANEEYDSLCKKRNAKRGSGGFGSTDKKLGK